MVSVLRLLARTRVTDDYFLLPALMQQLGGPQNPLERFFFTVFGVRISDVTKPCSGITPETCFCQKVVQNHPYCHYDRKFAMEILSNTAVTCSKPLGTKLLS